MTATTPLPLAAALAQLLQGISPVAGSEDIPLNAALGRVLAGTLRARLDTPPCDNSAMDGYAVRAADAGRDMPVIGRVAAGDAPTTLQPDGVARIFTGAPVPAGADAVVPQEDVVTVAGGVRLPAAVVPGQHIRRRGEDSQVDDELLTAGHRLRPQDIGLIAAQGIDRVTVRPRLRVALLTTGSELIEAGSADRRPGTIFNSNGPMLRALLAALGCTVLDLGTVADTPDATREALAAAAGQADLILSSGGVSVGEVDLVREAVAELGAIALWKVAIKPGKPFAYGRVADTTFMGLPGNPASAFVTFLLLARPWIHARQGRGVVAPRAFQARADLARSTPGTRDEYLRVTLHPEPAAGEATEPAVSAGGGGEGVAPAAVRLGLWARPFPNQSSGVLRSISASEALARVPAGRRVAHGDPLEVLPLDLMLF